MILLHKVKDALHLRTSRYLSKATLVEGVMKDGSCNQFRFLFIGDSSLVNYFSDRTFTQGKIESKRRFLRISSVNKFIAKYSEQLDICFAVIPKEYDGDFKELNHYKCDVRVGQKISLAGNIEDIKKRFHKTKRQIFNSILSKSNMTYRISRDLKDFDYFYHEMFLPHISKKYGDLLIEPYEGMKGYFLKGFILLVQYEGQIVSGALCIVQDKSLVFRRTGVLHGDKKYIQLGAQNALYLFLIMHAKKMGLDSLDTMKTVSVLNDSVFIAKREWGAEVYPDDESRHWVYMIFPKVTENIARFFEMNPLMVHTEDGLCGLIGVNGDTHIVNESRKELIKKYHSPGIDRLLVLTLDSEKAITIPCSGCG